MRGRRAIDALRVALVRLGSDAAALRGRLAAAGVERTFVVCSTPRTGSTMLGDLLADTGLVGRAGEYFGEPFRRQVVPGLSRRGFDDYLVACTRHARGTGAFGVKLHWDQVEVFLHLLRLRRGLSGRSDGEVLEAIFPSVRFVSLRREDEVAQAVSWWKAITTGRWTDGRPPVGEPRFDADGIRTRLRRIEQHNAAWEAWFRANGIEPLRLTYEELVADPASVARRTLLHLGVQVPPGLAVRPRTERQADGVNADWIRRYRELVSTGAS
ncbi:MAG TPA: Stf0 family sulfotransferase [Gaiellaceae bacterium]|nr:Stf0 family sulfotransferase [Gaiellaceae bacterium]